MNLKFQYNKTEIQRLTRQLEMREKALPTLQNKETALRLEVQRARQRLVELRAEAAAAYADVEPYLGLFRDLPDVLAAPRVTTQTRNIAGVKFRVLKEVAFELKPFVLFNQPPWVLLAAEWQQRLIRLRLAEQLTVEEVRILDLARKKTTQKVNLYERVQMPAYRDAIRQIKRFLEDQENLSKAAQKIVKNRRAA